MPGFVGVLLDSHKDVNNDGSIDTDNPLSTPIDIPSLGFLLVVCHCPCLSFVTFF
jgi:hypothetical protein